MNDNIAAPTAAEQDAASPAHDDGGGGGASAGFAGFSGVSLTPYYWIFAASGFAGLIYESVWARYIKLFLGNAASAQVLVLAVFLVSLAIGAALCAKISERLERPLLLYAAIEVVVALVAVYFHDIFVAAQNWAVLSVMPQLESDFAVDAFKLAFAAALIAPQTILLGATFPLMSAGLARLRPDSPGRVISLLYFTNTLGGAAGVLVSGFLLVPTLGLPGTVLIAGLLNAFAGGAVWWLSRRQELGKVLTAAAASASAGGGVLGERGGLQTVILTAAFVTGLASLVYEVVWIRMLSVLLGPVTQIFELMLAAFILGLALGGWAVRRRADAAGEPLFLLAGVQLAMGVLALWSLFAFPLFYDILRQTLVEISRDETGYRLYNLLAGGLAMAMMLPAAFCAGMTLPLLTRRLLSAGGEGAIGKVYAVNTLGAVVGAAAALVILLPNIGIQLSIAAAAALNMLLGLLLFLFVAARRSFAVGTGLTAAALAAALLFGGISPQIAAASVFYRPTDELPLVVFHKNGKTAYVAVTEETRNDIKRRTIKTNGVINAAVSMSDTPGDGTLAIDEITTTMLGLLPLLYRPDAETVMNIGFGSGMTTRTLLSSPALRRLDNVEIEPVMVEGAKELGPRVAPVFADERNRFIFNDAKTVLARGDKYDIIISEPPFPWISGVAGLFTKEFYARIRRSLTKNGVFAQWMPMHEQSPQQVASVVQALAAEFGDFNLYLVENSSLLFVAAADKLPPLKSDIFATPETRKFLEDYRYTSVNDAEIAFLGDKELLMPYFMSFNVPTNSDYYPYLENNAFRTAFLRTDFIHFGQIPLLPVPLLEMLSGGGGYSAAGVSPQPYSPLRAKAAQAARFFAERHAPDGELQRTLADIATLPCPAEVDTDFRVLEKISSLVSLLTPITEKEKMEEIWEILETNDCITRLLAQNDTVVGVYARFWRALSLRDAAEITLTTDALLPYAELDQPSGQILLLAAAAAHYQQQNYRRAILLLLDMPQINPVSAQAARWVGALAAEKL